MLLCWTLLTSWRNRSICVVRRPELRSKKAESSAATAVFLGGRREGGVGSVYAEHAAWPGSRTYPASFTAGGSHLLFGGFGFGEAGTDAEERIGRLADLW